MVVRMSLPLRTMYSNLYPFSKCFYPFLNPCLFKVGAVVPSVPGQPGTSSLPISPPRQLCRWRRTAAVGIAAPPPPSAPHGTPPAAFAGPAVSDGSLPPAHIGFRQRTNQDKRAMGIG